MSAYIYGIKNNKNNLYYVGQTINLSTRKYRHFNDLKRGVHPNRHLQYSYNKYGQEVFSFEVLEEVKDYSIIKERENYWIDKIGYYNIDKGRTGFTPIALRNMSESHIGKISSRRLLNKEQVFDFLAIEEFIGDYSRPFARQIKCNRVVPKSIINGTCYQDYSKEYLNLPLSNRLEYFRRASSRYSLNFSRFTEKTASSIWFLYKNKQNSIKQISILLNKDIKSVERVLNKETLKKSYEIYSRLSEQFLEELTNIIINNTVPS